MIQKISLLPDLFKLKISLLSSLSAATGYILATHSLSLDILSTVTGIFLLACGASVLNQYQERHTDSLMERTKNRPITSGKLSPGAGLFMSLCLLITGSICLSSNLPSLTLVLFICAWYNLVYTHLKKKTSFSMIAGAITGALIPVTGWLNGGGFPLDKKIIAMVCFFFIWQIPHSWLNILSYGRDYEKSGFPSITRIFNEKQLCRITFIWILATGITGLLIPLFIINSFLINIFLFLSTMWLIWRSSGLFFRKEKKFSFAFNDMNIYAFTVICLLSIDKLLLWGKL
jgi:protoheme IX farnesyltransferase